MTAFLMWVLRRKPGTSVKELRRLADAEKRQVHRHAARSSQGNPPGDAVAWGLLAGPQGRG